MFKELVSESSSSSVDSNKEHLSLRGQNIDPIFNKRR
jgi:hypothetical protein